LYRYTAAKKAETRERLEKARLRMDDKAVGLYKLTHSLKAPGFNL
jgi:hypothetical protein